MSQVHRGEDFSDMTAPDDKPGVVPEPFNIREQIQRQFGMSDKEYEQYRESKIGPRPTQETDHVE